MRKNKLKNSKDKNKKHSPFKILKNLIFMIKFSVKYTPNYIVFILLDMLGRTASTILNVLFTKYIFDAIEKGVPFTEALSVIIFVAVFNALTELLFLWRYEVYRPQAELALHEGMQKELYAKARALDQSCYDDPEFYNDFIWAIRESDGRVSWIMLNLNVFPNRIISFISLFALLSYMDIVVALIFVVAAFLGFFVKKALNKAKFDKKTDLNPIDRKISYINRIFYMSDRAKELRQGQIADHFRKQLFEVNEERTECIRKHAKKTVGLSLINTILTETVPSAGVTGYLILRFLFDSTLSLGTFSASINASFKLYWELEEISTFLNVFGEHSLYVERVRKFLEYEPKIKGEVKDIPSFESLSIKNVTFSYPFSSNDKAVLEDVNIEIKKGEKIAFVGYNGAGKTTLIKLLMRLYDTSEEGGEILYNGKNIKDLSPEAYRDHIGAVFQDYKVFAATVAENVLGDEYHEGDEETVLKALRAASFEEKLAELPGGIHTQLTREFTNDGVMLSGGESQKIAIARIFARPFELVIMDEPSSALDPIAEYELNNSIMNYASDKTVIFISHRLSTTQMADRIYMFDGGKIIESGSHKELMRANGKYAQMYTLQAKKYRTKT